VVLLGGGQSNGELGEFCWNASGEYSSVREEYMIGVACGGGQSVVGLRFLDGASAGLRWDGTQKMKKG
jgi:hypothetical protein